MNASSKIAPGAFIILGMHRSGTSCLAGSLEQAGVFLGGVNKTAPHNAKGNQENLAIMDLHNAILQASGGDWDAPPEVVEWHAEHRLRRDEIIATYPSDEIWGFKDPRTLLTLEGWLEAMPSARIIGTFRHPNAVAQSLHARNRFTREKSVALWTNYNTRLLRYQRQLGFDLACFDWPPVTYHQRLNDIFARLSLSQLSLADSFFEANLRVNHAVPDSKLPKDAAEIYQALIEVAS